ncbi:glucose 1-dehydrogenase [Subsaximicrobium wynnwilliamsii]|uniref:Glucose 1-dehydrogenase n=1 Tax=Subsaximicrobium wynnwilliamsii TaxID=291179 RepID=A0A5C6ZQX3_9FLAO|nr:3-oxoacyl-ACP reductase FabG [Subsaximicrobium wynnwilliamsii]TXD85251.1 glucose 1-dehydrogenase [Subsaximicrobium wynnwilliamsii]TXD91293.1 glucose 1-dehydrogenase [Subsaximicrobium wynnwilliamsii]TXE04687.1 glucose 1-dehydrogenase [Subsaximicrobium wynnwilliamsii]
MRLKDKIAIITGGSQGIGKAISELFAKEGATVIIMDVLPKGEEVANEISESGGKAEFHKVSVTDKISVEKLFEQVNSKYGKIDILINNAGITRDRTLEKMSEAEFDAVIEVNLKGVFICTQAVAPYMKANNYGRIVSAASNVGLRGNFGQTNYAATKAGVIAMSKTWTMELGKYGITANAIAPGFTMTDMVDKIPEAQLEAIKGSIPLKTVAQPIDIAYGYLYLASDEARFVSGICLTIDGGTSR